MWQRHQEQLPLGCVYGRWTSLGCWGEPGSDPLRRLWLWSHPRWNSRMGSLKTNKQCSTQDFADYKCNLFQKQMISPKKFYIFSYRSLCGMMRFIDVHFFFLFKFTMQKKTISFGEKKGYWQYQVTNNFVKKIIPANNSHMKYELHWFFSYHSRHQLQIFQV